MNIVLICLDYLIYMQSVFDYVIWVVMCLGVGMELMYMFDCYFEYVVIVNFSGSIGLGSNEVLLQELVMLDEKCSKLVLECGCVLFDEVV